MRRLVLLLSVVLAVGIGDNAHGQSTGQPTISEIEVVGALTVGSRQVLAWSGIKAGVPYSRDLVSAGILNLFQTRKFSDVFIYRQDTPEGVKLIINLEEFPRIRTIRFQGNKKVKDKDLREAFPVHVGQFANPAVTRRELKPLRDLYYEKGYYNVAINTDSTVVDANNMEDMVITVVEGQKVKVQTITFKGQSVLEEDDLRDAMEQGTKGFLRSGTFKKQQFEADRERIVTYCRNEGFLDAAVTDVEMNFREDKEKLDLVIHLEEGPRYYIGDIDWQGNTVFDDLVIADIIWLDKGNVFKEDIYLETLGNLQQIYADRGYIYITVEPQREIVDQTVNVSFTFIEGQPAKIHDIQISGNTKTYDKVIIREMRTFPGDTFSNTRIQATMRDIFQTGFFEDVQPDIRPVANGDVDMILKVKEKQTGQFMFGMAYSAETSASGFIQVAETNFQGKGQNLGVTWQFGSRQRYVDISFTEPWFMGTPTLVGADIFDRYQYNFDDFYESRIRGFSARLGRRIPGTRYSRVGLRYELSQTRLSNFSPGYVKFLNDLEESLGSSDLPWQRLDQIEWPQLKSSIRMTFNRNSTDSPFFPTSGSKSMYSLEWAGGPLGGEIEFQEHMMSHSYYQGLPGGFVLHLRGFFGLLHGLNSPDDVPDWERYRLGGNRRFPLRGYKDLEVVPRGNPSFIGGRFFSIFNTEVLYPLTKAIQLLSFLDMGDVWNSFSEADISHLRKGAGFGIRVEVPMMGTIGFDYGYGFDRLGGPRWEPHFTIGSIF
ncbi:MAG: outer membrane protein assembly factor BamA [Candidatus Krumholzibacteriota bacterium]